MHHLASHIGRCAEAADAAPAQAGDFHAVGLQGFQQAGLGRHLQLAAAALQGGDKKPKVKASSVFVQQLRHNVQKMPQDRVKTGRNRPQTDPKQPKIG